MITAIAIDDEPAALKVLQRHAMHSSSINMVASFTKVCEAMAFMTNHNINALFIDIDMPEQNGLAIAQQIPAHVQIVFCTAYPQFALQGFDLNATDYLQKPVSLERFLVACNKLMLKETKTRQPLIKHYKVDGLWMAIDFTKVMFLEARGNYVLICAQDTKPVLCRSTLKNMASTLPSFFIQINKGIVVNVHFITRFDNKIVEQGFRQWSIGEKFLDVFRQKMGLVDKYFKE